MQPTLTHERAMSHPREVDLPFVSVLVPARNEEHFIERCVRSLMAQDYPSDQYELLIMDGSSSDRTKEVVRSLMQEFGNLRLYDNPGITAPAAMNVGIREARGEIIVRMDAHSRTPPDYVRAVVTDLIEHDVDHVGVNLFTEGRGFWGRCIALGMSAPFGVGGAKHRTTLEGGWDEPGCLGGFRKATVLRVGGFDEALIINEDEDLLFRIERSGGRFYRTPRAPITYYCRDSLRKLWVQYFRYGFYKPRVLLKNKTLYLRHLVPAAFVGALLAALVLGVVVGPVVGLAVLGAVLIPYFLLTGVFSLKVLPEEGAAVAAALPLVFFTLHLSYGSGFLLGILFDLGRSISFGRVFRKR